jgi:DNA repair ATPase RecN
VIRTLDTSCQVTQLSSKLKDADEILSRKEETLESETRRLQLAQKRLDHIKALQKTLKHRRDVLKDAKRKFETQQSNAQNKADSLKVQDCDITLHAFL